MLATASAARQQARAATIAVSGARMRKKRRARRGATTCATDEQVIAYLEENAPVILQSKVGSEFRDRDQSPIGPIAGVRRGALLLPTMRRVSSENPSASFGNESAQEAQIKTKDTQGTQRIERTLVRRKKSQFRAKGATRRSRSEEMVGETFSL